MDADQPVSPDPADQHDDELDDGLDAELADEAQPGGAADAGAVADPAAFTADDANRAAAPAPRLSVRLVGCAPALRVRILAAVKGESVDAGAATLDLVVVSTRATLSDAVEAVREASAQGVPVAVLAHPGGRDRALDLLASGADAVVHEGHEESLRALAAADERATVSHAGVVDRFAAALGPASDSFTRAVAVDPATGLPGDSAFRERLDDLAREGRVPTVVGLRVPGLAAVLQRVAPPAASLLLRRVAAAWRAVLESDGARLHRTGPEAFAVLDPRGDVDALAPRLVAVGDRYRPDGRPLSIGIGVARPDDVTAAHEAAALADEAALASASAGGHLFDAAALAAATAPSAALDSLLDAVARVDAADRHRPGHGERTARVAVAIGRRLGLDGPTLEALRVAAHAHDVGKVALPVDVAAGPDGLDGEQLEAYRSHPSRGATVLRPLAGDDVAEAVGSHHEAWDGSGYPEGLEGDDIPLLARIVAVADRWDAAAATGSVEDAVAGVRADAGTVLDPNIVDTAVRALARHLVDDDATANA